MGVSIVIPTKNRIDDLKRCLTSLIPQLTSEDQVIVVDNDSVDGTMDYIRKLDQVEPVHDSTPNLAHLFNVGWRQATNEIIGFLNDDSDPCENWIREVRWGFSQLPVAGAIGGPTNDLRPRFMASLFKQKGSLVTIYDKLVMGGRLADFGVLTPWGAFSLGQAVPPVPTRVSGLTITNMAVRKSILAELGGFDEDLRWSHIDGLFFIQLQRRGIPMYSLPRMAVNHYVNPKGATRSAFYLNRDQAVFFRKLKPRSARERLHLMANVLAGWMFWAIRSKGEGGQVLLDALRGYVAGSL